MWLKNLKDTETKTRPEATFYLIQRPMRIEL